ncbi:MAG: bifunctional folylpolyglutamate synthase/dihydrofolate synthase [Verrucomicrobia bacterium CG_4_10_14_3_um_filter_43_23]|nr:MAG: bifunctional folylpolyglutamate synthase/dihydrofolate synthase [Verrucomicrobia bacterium CG_4_10_14_3_um_filter_43_23]
MGYTKAQEYLYSLRNSGSKLGLERIKILAEELSNPQNNFPSIHVTGTNGKGSVCSMLDSIYRTAGYKTGLHTSPHLVYLGERIRVNGQNLSRDKIVQYTEELSSIADKSGVSFFEFMTGITFLEFAREGVDIAIIEVGLGGEHDSTNIINPEISVITSISKDHTNILGNSLSEIAHAKAGIIKQNTPVVIGVLPLEAEAVIRKVAKQKNAPVYAISGSNYPETALHGSCQRENAAIASLVVNILQSKFPVSEAAKSKGLMSVTCRGRWEKIKLITGQTLILDASHNEGSAAILAKNLAELHAQTGKQFTFVCGTLGEDRAQAIFATIAAHAHEIYLVTINQPRATPANELLKIAPPKASIKSLSQLFSSPNRFLPENSSDIIIVTGSIYLLGEVLSLIDETAALHNEVCLQDKI